MSDHDDDDDTAIVIDNGSGLLKAGFAGDESPRTIFPTIIGRLYIPGYVYFDGIDEMRMELRKKNVVHVGDDVRDTDKCYYPIKHGIVTRFDDMEKIWQYTFYNNLRVVPKDHAILMTEVSLNPKPNREKMTQIMFETFNVPSYYVSNQSVLTLYAAGKTTGIVLESGDGITNVTPIYENYVLSHAVLSLNITGKDVTYYLETLLKKKGYDNYSLTMSRRKIIRDIKEKLCYVALDYDKQISSSQTEIEYELPDGQCIKLDKERFQCTEVLFNPELIGMEKQDGIHKLVYQSIMKCDVDIRSDLWNNIIFGGGNTMFNGLSDRFLNEMEKLLPNCRKILVDGYLRMYYDKHREKPFYKDIVNLMKEYTSENIKVIASAERKYSAWIGGSILASLSTFEDMWIKSEEYYESGPGIVHRKCII